MNGDETETNEQLMAEPVALKREGKTARNREDETLYTFFSRLPIGIYLVQDGKFKFVNPVLRGLLGRGEGELSSSASLDVVHPDDRQSALENGIKMLKGERTTPYEFRVIDANGEIRWVTESVASIEYQGRRAILGNYMDITERKRLEEALRQSEASLTAAQRIAHLGNWDWDIAKEEVVFSGEGYRILGTTPEGFGGSGEAFIEFVHPEDKGLILPALTAAVDRQQPYSLDFRIVRADGTLRFVHSEAEPVCDEEGKVTHLVGTIHDITEQKRAEEEKKEIERKAHLASRLASVGEMAAGIAHEINNPLTAVIGFAQLLMQKDIPEDIKRDVEIIYHGAQRVSSIVRGLLAFARQQEPEYSYTNIKDAIRSTLELRAYSLKTNSIKINKQFQPDLPKTMADSGQLQQVFLNIIINAETAMKTARGRGKLLVRAEAEDDVIRIIFEDDGPGIPEKNLGKIFDPFFTTGEVGVGTGLGLSVCHGIIAEHGGRIYAESKPGKGATFVIELPVRPEEKTPEPNNETRGETESTSKVKILVVDDEPTVQKFLSDLLTKSGHSVDVAGDAETALEMIQNKRYSLILLDVVMPGMGGVELYAELKKIASSLAKRVLFITGNIMDRNLKGFLNRTKAAHVSKPFDIELLKSEIAKIINV